MLKFGVAAALVALAGCAEFPRDPERTEALVRESKAIRLGWVTAARPDPKGLAVLSKLEEATGARIQSKQGDSETPMRELEEGKIDLVYGHFAPRRERPFVYMPLMHSEAIADQRASLGLFGGLGGDNFAFARAHHRMIARFGRFPHRNAVLGRESSAAEWRAVAEGFWW